MGGIIAIWGVLGFFEPRLGFTAEDSELAIIFGAIFVALSVFFILRLGSSAPVRLRIDDRGFMFIAKNGKELAVRWVDPQLKANVSQFAGDPTKVFHPSDARYKRPYWVTVWQPNLLFAQLETTIPEEAAVAIVERAQEFTLQLLTTRVAFFWHSGPKGSGWLEFASGDKIPPGASLNGEITQLRGVNVKLDNY
jgi:anaerobic selenocysteine-containing dehydrogenase